MTVNIQQLAKKIGYKFKDPQLLQTALTHRSRQLNNNERLEFLGDSILNFIIAEKLYHLYPKAKEGELTRLRASLVNGETLAQIAKEFELGLYLSLGTGEIKSGGRERNSILADALEALLAAVYLDAKSEGLLMCTQIVEKWYETRLNNQMLASVQKDPKTTLQEYLQGKKIPIPRYSLLHSAGTAQQQLFEVECRIEHLELFATGVGTSRRKAEQEAAKQILLLIQQNG